MNWEEEKKDEESPAARVILYLDHVWINEEINEEKKRRREEVSLLQLNERVRIKFIIICS